MKKLCVAFFLFLSTASFAGPAWVGESLTAWTKRGHEVKSAKVENGILKVACGGRDTHLYSSTFDIAATGEQYLVFRARGSHSGMGEIFWMAPGKGATQDKSCKFKWQEDKGWRTYHVHLPWNREKRIGQIRLDFPPEGEAGGKFEIAKLEIVDGEPDIPAELKFRSIHCLEHTPRVENPFTVSVLVENLGTQPARDVTVVPYALSKDIEILNRDALTQTVWGGETVFFEVQLKARRSCADNAVFDIRCKGQPQMRATIPLLVQPSLHLRKAQYVPEPKPVKTDYDLAALYFPGWAKATAWERVWKVCPERRPMLGWYDEANPECVDWQIKWLVENGIRTLYVDWYWCKGSQHLDHWVKAFYQSRYHNQMKWAMMWANHNAAGSHSIDDQKAVTKFWIENYFRTPEYLKIDGKPVVWIWSPDNMQRDIPKGGCQRLLEVSREMAIKAGFKGIHFMAMKWPEADCSAETMRKYQRMGFDEVGIYHFMSPGDRAKSPNRYAFSDVAAENPENWRKQFEAKVMPFLPNLSTGWDDRPWNNHCEIYGKNAHEFRKICQAAKEFADRTGIKRICLAPLNEWGEGSYAEPNAEHGFGFYEAVRDTFCIKPEQGWPLNYAPRDVGLGPYDLPKPERPAYATKWDFTDGKLHGWAAMMGLASEKLTAVQGVGITCESIHWDSAIAAWFMPIQSKEFQRVVVRMKCEGKSNAGNVQLFWANPNGGAREAASISQKVICDGAFHDYVFEVGKHHEWRGRIAHFRLDPVGTAGVKIKIASIRCE